MKSQFSSWIGAPIFVLACSLAIIIIFASLTERMIRESPGLLALYALPLFLLYWIVFGELRLRAIRVELGRDRLVVRHFLGLGRAHTYYYAELDGYVTRLLPSEYGHYEYLFVQQNGKRLVRLSQFYHRNYANLKKEISRRLKERDRAPFSWKEELGDTWG